MRFRKPEVIPLLFIIGAVCLLAGLGGWQLKRLAWKEDLIAAVTHAQSLPALEALPPALEGLAYRKVMLQGRFLHDKTLRKAGGRKGMGPGFFLFAPFRLAEDGRIILVNRGFAPEGQESRPPGMQRVEGILRPPRQKPPFLPENQPATNVWFHEDLPAMQQATGLTLLPMVVEAVGTYEKNLYPIPGNGNITLRNDHLGYAITWFSLALVGLIMFVIYHRIPNK